MSLSSLLLRSANNAENTVDKGLDAIFQSTAPLPARATSESGKNKRKKKEETHRRSKKPRVDTNEDVEDTLGRTVTSSQRSEQEQNTKSKSKAKRKEKAIVEFDEAQETEFTSRGSSPREEPSNHSSGQRSPSLVHESLLKNRHKHHGGKGDDRLKKIKYVPPNETAEQRDSRTIFIGNVPSEVAKSRPLLKQFKRHILSYAPSAQIESVRFRSIAFQEPTTKLENEDDQKQKPDHKEPDKQPRQHDLQRVSSWRDSKDSEAGTVASEKKYLTPQEKKRVAFIKHNFHQVLDVVTAYVVFAHPHPTGMRAANVPAPAPVMDPRIAACLAVEKADGSVFHQKTIRVDFVQDKSTGSNEDPKLSIFVGNLDFASKEEDLRVFFEGLVSTERGAPAGADQSDEEVDGTKSSGWVTRVRIIRDKDTQLGKGFAYVQFVDRECVDEILALEEGKIKFAKRKLRVQRCKSLPVGSGGVSKARLTPTHTVPRGDPSLGKQLEHLSKEERKQRKASDAGRVARRLAKKKVKTAMGKASVKMQVKDRERIRRRRDQKETITPKAKSRVTSEPSQRTQN